MPAPTNNHINPSNNGGPNSSPQTPSPSVTDAVTGSVSSAQDQTEQLNDLKNDAVDQASALRTNAQSAFEAKRKALNERTHNGATLAEDIVKNFSFGFEVIDMVEAKLKFNNYSRLESEAQSLDTKNPNEFVSRYEQLSERISDARDYEQALNEATQMNDFQRWFRTPEHHASNIVAERKQASIEAARNENAQEPEAPDDGRIPTNRGTS